MKRNAFGPKHTDELHIKLVVIFGVLLVGAITVGIYNSPEPSPVPRAQVSADAATRAFRREIGDWVKQQSQSGKTYDSFYVAHHSLGQINNVITMLSDKGYAIRIGTGPDGKIAWLYVAWDDTDHFMKAIDL